MDLSLGNFDGKLAEKFKAIKIDLLNQKWTRWQRNDTHSHSQRDE